MRQTCLVTGAYGYLGKHIVNHLSKLNYNVCTLGVNKSNTYQYDLSTQEPSFDKKFTAVIHCAGKAHCFPSTNRERQAFFDVNVTGTKNLLSALLNSSCLPESFVFLSSVSVYGLSVGSLINEQAPLKAVQPYGQSKIQAEQMVIEWCKTHNVKCTILRLPLLAGRNPPGNLGALIRAIKSNYYFNLFKDVRKSMVMVEDVAKIIPNALSAEGIYNLTDGEHPYIKELADLIAGHLGKVKPLTLPKWIGKPLLILAGIFQKLFPTEVYKVQTLASSLTFDDSKARAELGWKPSKVLYNFFIE